MERLGIIAGLLIVRQTGGNQSIDGVLEAARAGFIP